MLEPLAPGTEDEFQLPQVTKKETEQERLLSQKAYLANGKYGGVFELTYVNGVEHWYCNICQCPVMGRAYHHEIGKRHCNNMAQYNKVRVKGGKEQPEPEPEPVQMDIAPGEPVPPGFEDEVQKTAMIQERLNGYNVGPLVGLEYVLELQDLDPAKEAYYLCILCDKKGDPRTVLTHLSSYNHISQYLQKHFRAAYRALAPYMTKQYKRNWQTCLQKIAEAIERRFGRLYPYPVEQDKFEKNRLHYLAKIAQGRHFQEAPNCTFEELIKKEEMTKSLEDSFIGVSSVEDNTAHNRAEAARADERQPFRKAAPGGAAAAAGAAKRSPSPPVVQRPQPGPKRAKTMAAGDGGKAYGGGNPTLRKKSLSPVSSVSSNEGESRQARGGGGGRRPSPPLSRYDRDRGYTRRRSPSPYNRRPYRRSPSPKRRPDFRDRRDVPWQRSNYSRPKIENDRHVLKKSEREEKLEEFKKLSKAIENDMDRIWKQHERNPEKHPNYNEEWKKFWNKRYKELQAEGKDASKHDFKPEWIVYWNKSMKQLHEEELKTKKEALRKRLGLVEEPAPIKFRIQNKDKRQMSPVDKKPIPPAACPDSDPEVIIIDDKEDSRSFKSNNRRSHSPDDKEPPFKQRKPNRLREGSLVREYDRPSPEGRPGSFDRKSPPFRRSPGLRRRSSPDRLSPVRKHSLDRRSSPAKRRSPDRSERWQDRRSEERKSNSGGGGRRSMDKRGEGGNGRRSPDRKLDEGRRSADRKSLDRLSLDRISSSASSSDEQLNRPDKYYDDYRPQHGSSRDGRGGSPGVTYVRERDMGRERDKLHRPSGMAPYHHSAYYEMMKPPKVMREATREPVLPPGEEVDDADINVVGVLRLLTALEEKLGSLGPKVNDLLSQALAMEKAEANSSEQLLDNDVNCVLFETVKEKLKGQLQAGLVEYPQEKAYKIAIKKAAGLVHVAGVRKSQQAKKEDPLRVPGIGHVDKAAIAKQIATALVLQGKTDVTQDELETLINAVVGMAEASQKTNKPMTTASFIDQISGALGTKTPPEPEPEKKSPEPTVVVVQDSPVKEAPKPKEVAKDSPKPLRFERPNSNPGNMDHLSDSDLQTLLQNFKDLSSEEQHGLISYLKKLEAKEPERVEKLRQFVNLGSEPLTKAEKNEEKPPDSPASLNSDTTKDDMETSSKGLVITIDDVEENAKDSMQNKEKEPKDMREPIESDEEDYNFEDVVKAVSKNVEAKEQEKQRVLEEQKKKQEKEQLMDTQALISNLISNFSKSTGSGQAAQPPVSVSTADFTKTLNNLPINLDNLADIVGNVKTLQDAQNQQNFGKTDIFEESSNSSQPSSLERPPAVVGQPDKGGGGGGIALNLLPRSTQSRAPQDRKDKDMMDLPPPFPTFGASAGAAPPPPPPPILPVLGKQVDSHVERPFFEPPDFGFERERPLAFERPYDNAPGDRDRVHSFDRQDHHRQGGGGGGGGPMPFDVSAAGHPNGTPFDRPGAGGLDRAGPPPGDRPGPGPYDRNKGPGSNFDRSGRAMMGGFDRSAAPGGGGGGGFDRPNFERSKFDRGGQLFGFDRPNNNNNNPQRGGEFGRDGQEFDRPPVSRPSPGISKARKPFDHDQFDIEKPRQGGRPDDFDIPGPDNSDRRTAGGAAGGDFPPRHGGMNYERPLSDRLAPAMNRLNNVGGGADRLGGGGIPSLLDARRGGGGGGMSMDRFADRTAPQDMDRSDPFIPPLGGGSQDRGGSVQYPGKPGMPVRGKNPQYTAKGGYGDGFDDGFGNKPFSARGRGGFNRW